MDNGATDAWSEELGTGVAKPREDIESNGSPREDGSGNPLRMPGSDGLGQDGVPRPGADGARASRSLKEPVEGRRDGRRGGDWAGDAARAATRARDMASQAEAGPDFLAEASRLLAESLDYETTLATVAGLALPQLGAWCIVDVTEPDGSLRRLAVVHPDPDKQVLARRLETHWPPERDDPIGVPRVMRTLHSEVIPSVTQGMLEEFARNDHNLRLLKALGMGSLLVVPLAARGEVLGAVTFVSPRGGRTYDESDLELAEDLANRSAIALDNARLHRVTEEALEEAERANEAKSLFLTTMSHELRTPINAIVGYAELLEMELNGPITEGQREHIERIRASSKHLLGLVTEVLDLAKVDAGEMTVRRERGAVDDAVIAALGMVAPQARFHDISLVNECERGCGVSYVGDEERVCQVVMNLVSNAVKFTLPGGTVAVRCGVTHEPAPTTQLTGGGPWAWIAVEDDGIGIARKDQDHIFEPFTQVRNGLTREVGGTGLGLTLSRKMAHLMGGDLTLESALGEGATFTLWLPTDRTPASRSGRRARKNARPPRPGGALARCASAILARIEAINDALVDRLEAELPSAAEATPAALRDHVGSLVADVAHSMLVLAEGGDRHPHLLRDGTKIQRLIAELHGGQRQRLGWTDADMAREFEIIGEEIRAAIRSVEGLEEKDRARASVVAGRFLDQAHRVSRQGLRTAHTASSM